MCLGIPGKIISICDSAGPASGIVDVSGVRRKVNLECVVGNDPDALIGEWVLVHVGFAMSIIDADEAAATLAALDDLGEAMEAVEAMRHADAMLAADAGGTV